MKKIMFNDKYGLTKAVIEGRKTQTRRVISPQPTYKNNCGICWKGYAYGLNVDYGLRGTYRNFVTGTEYDKSCRRYRKGEIVAIAQSYRDCGGLNEQGRPNWDVIAEAKGTSNACWNNKMFVCADLMPHQIRITDVRVEHLQDISDYDCIQEGVHEATRDFPWYWLDCIAGLFNEPCQAFAHLINKVSRKDVWSENPYVFVYDFELVK